MHTKMSGVRLALIAGIFGSLILTVPVIAQGAAIVKVDPAQTTIALGQQVTVFIKIDNVTDLVGGEIHMTFNANVLEVLDADPNTDGVQISNGGMLVADFSGQNEADNVNGRIDFGIQQINRSAVTGSGTFAVINFRGKAAGDSPVTFIAIPSATTGVNLVNSAQLAISHTTQSGSVSVSPGTGTPSPSPTPTNTPTPGPSPTPTPIGTGTPGKHIVRAGETLYCIGRAYTVSPWAIATTNGLYPPYRLYVGQVLTIPNVPWTNIPAGPVCARQFPGTPPPPTPGPTPPPPVGCRAIYTVIAGDTLLKISRAYNVNVFTLAARNNIYNLNLIYIGQKLCIP